MTTSYILESSILDEISELSQIETSLQNGAKIEVEVRFGNFIWSEKGKNRFVPDLGEHKFGRIISNLGNPSSIENTTDYIYSNNNPLMLGVYGEKIEDTSFSLRYSINTETNDTQLISKQGYKENVDKPSDYSVRISFKIESPLAITQEIVDLLNQTQPDLIRKKERRSFMYVSGTYRLDLTKVTTISHNNEENITYEMELEILNLSKVKDKNEKNENLLNILLLPLYREWLESPLIYNITEHEHVIGSVNFLLTGKKGFYIGNHLLNQPRNIKLYDMVDGVLISKVPYPVSSSYEPPVEYTVTIKADGVRKLMYIDVTGIYIIGVPDKVMKIVGKNAVSSIGNLYGYVVEGEFFEKKHINMNGVLPTILEQKLDKVKYIFLLYDCLAISGSSNKIQKNMADIRQYNHLKRVEYLEPIVNSLSTLNSLYVDIKEFVAFNTANSFYESVISVLNEPWWFDIDGLIFTPNGSYKGRDDETGLRDTLKWKPLNQLTIDLQVERVLQNGESYFQLLTEGRKFSSRTGKKEKILKPFTGSRYHQFDSRNDLLTEKLLQVNNGDIIEFRPIINGSEINKVIKLDYYRHRYDKKTPNAEKTVIDIWEDINDPITEDIIRGKQFRLVFKYHNRLKAELYQTIARSLPDREKTLLCIGSGRGGDVKKWIDNGFTKVLCIEPNEENRQELKRRLDDNGKIEYYIVAGYGQELNKIFEAWSLFFNKQKVDAIVYMLSLSFFFDNVESFKSIIRLSHNLIKPGGYFGTFTVDGTAVLDYFNNPINYQIIKDPTKKVKLSKMSQIVFRLTEDEVSQSKEIYIHIPDSIVENQNEYITNLPLLERNLNINGFTKIMEKKANMIDFLNPEEKIYTSMYKSLLMKAP